MWVGCIIVGQYSFGINNNWLILLFLKVWLKTVCFDSKHLLCSATLSIETSSSPSFPQQKMRSTSVFSYSLNLYHCNAIQCNALDHWLCVSFSICKTKSLHRKNFQSGWRWGRVRMWGGGELARQVTGMLGCKYFFEAGFFYCETFRWWRGGPTQPQCCPSPLL